MICMPEADARVLRNRAQIVSDLQRLVPGEGVIADTDEMRPYDCDALTAYREMPLVVVLPQTRDQVAAVLSYCHANKIRVVPRGSGTSLSGGALPLKDAVLLGTGKLNKILSIDLENRLIVTQPGVTNLALSKAVDSKGLFYAPDPSSQIACSIGGNVAENSGGVHCLKYGLTTNNVLGIEMVLMDGEVVRLGGAYPEAMASDLLGVCIGSEGLLGVVTEVTVRILPKPADVRAVLVGFPTVDSAALCVETIISSGLIPAGMEMMDKPAIHAAEAFAKAGYPLDVEALLIVELDGSPEECTALCERVKSIAAECGATTSRESASDEERMRFWSGRKSAFPAIGRLSPDYLCMDGTIPRRELQSVLRQMTELSQRYGLRVANVFHAGDGNLHPLIMYDANKPGELKAAEDFGADILRACVRAGGVLTGEHGVGIEKRDLMPEMYSEIDLKHQEYLKEAFDPDLLLNPGKVFPMLRRCAEQGREHVHHGQVKFPDLPRF